MLQIVEPNKLDYLSYSRMSMYLQCPSQWAYFYVDKNPRVDTVFTMFGSIIHELMEHLALNPESRTVEKALELYNAYWQEYALTDMDFYKRGIEMINAYLERDNAFAHEIIGVELQFGQDKDGNGEPMYIGSVPVLGYIDRVDKIDDESIIVRDYKTNIMPFSNEEVQNHLQMSMYDIIARMMFPWAKNVYLILDQPAYGEFKSVRTDEQRANTISFIENAWQQMLYDNTYCEKINKYCAYCIKRGECETYKRSLNMRVAIADPNDAVALWNEREQLVFQEKITKARIGEIDIAIKNMMAVNGKNVMPIQDSEFYFTQQRRKEYPMDTIRNIVASMGLSDVIEECTKFEKTKFEKHPKVKGNKVLMTMVDQCAIVSYTKPSLACRKINDAQVDE